jgi:TM2 domain-containing membrane protein YozV
LSDLVAVLGKPLTFQTPMQFFLTDASGTRHSINEEQLKALSAQGKITPTTPLETDTGHKGLAGQIPGLTFPTATQSPFAQPAQTASPAGSCFCTNCGNPVSEHAVACMSCGAQPVGHRRFCRNCGAALNPEQVVCIRCGAGVSTVGVSRSVGGGASSGTSWEKNKLVAGLLAIFLGGFGAHKYYMGSWGWGIVFTAAVFLTMGFAGLVTGIIGLIEGIMFLVMSEDTFAEKYPPETQAPFRW